jgi:hypothetical protein
MLAKVRFPYSDILGWSNSRYDTFSACWRRYYYQYYNKFDTDSERGHLLRLRDLTSIPIQVGSIAHDCIATLLRRLQKDTTAPVDQEKLFNYVSELTYKTVSQLQFSEIYYNEIDTIDPSKIADDVYTALGNLLRSERFSWITGVACDASQYWLIEPDRYGETRVDGLKAYCKVDFLFPVGEVLHIIDWKTGKEHSEKHSSQIRGYAAWASFQFKTPVTSIRPVVAYLLPEYHEADAQLRDEDMVDFAKLVYEQTKEMYALCVDVEKNIPKPKQSFPMTQIESFCGYCNFRELCKR